MSRTHPANSARTPIWSYLPRYPCTHPAPSGDCVRGLCAFYPCRGLVLVPVLGTNPRTHAPQSQVPRPSLRSPAPSPDRTHIRTHTPRNSGAQLRTHTHPPGFERTRRVPPCKERTPGYPPVMCAPRPRCNPITHRSLHAHLPDPAPALHAGPRHRPASPPTPPSTVRTGAIVQPYVCAVCRGAGGTRSRSTVRAIAKVRAGEGAPGGQDSQGENL